ncbi:C40 family peptidase [Stakelama sp. CBK3Z-3]|uniref:C40 family peptidase n=1 Tax=Stakelama flava TaxID=2860338 RepID=A0ABS6XQM1_9SPHN|nr:C40 family peptidase [Stakelama flava]MBW4332083.1 C40 family peptidase [Stakelama flava]
MQSSGISSRENPSTTRIDNGQARSRFALSGRSTHIDPRVDAARRDLADVRLADRVFSPHYAAPVAYTVGTRGPLFTDKQESDIRSELLVGERFDVLELVGDWCWGTSTVDGSVGYAKRALIEAASARPFIATAINADIRREASSQAPLAGSLPMGTRLPAPDEDGWITVGGGYIDATDCAAVQSLGKRDFVDVAEMLIGVPMSQGGRSGAGVSPDGLVFLAMEMAGRSAPRFADLQRTALGMALGEDAVPHRGDILYFADHCAILTSDGTAIHTDPAQGKVVREPVEAMISDARFGAVQETRRVIP